MSEDIRNNDRQFLRIDFSILRINEIIVRGKKEKLTASSKQLYCYLLNWPEAFPSHNKIADVFGITRKAAEKQVKKLIDLGLIERTTRPGSSNLYKVMPITEEMITGRSYSENKGTRFADSIPSEVPAIESTEAQAEEPLKEEPTQPQRVEEKASPCAAGSSEMESQEVHLPTNCADLGSVSYAQGVQLPTKEAPDGMGEGYGRYNLTPDENGEYDIPPELMGMLKTDSDGELASNPNTPDGLYNHKRIIGGMSHREATEFVDGVFNPPQSEKNNATTQGNSYNFIEEDGLPF